MDMFEAETGCLPEGQALAHQDKTILQVTQIRKENLPYDMCQRVDLVLVG